MVVLSVLRAAQPGCTKLTTLMTRGIAQGFNITNKPLVLQQLRKMSDKRTMQILPSRYEWTVLKDHLHFYILLGVIPLTLITVYANLFIGEAELADIPEDRAPKHWEYYKHPVSRFFAKLIMNDPQRQYEINLHYFHEEQEKVKFRKLEKKVKELIAERGDYKAWYYVPYNSDPVYRAHEERKQIDSNDIVP